MCSLHRLPPSSGLSWCSPSAALASTRAQRVAASFPCHHLWGDCPLPKYLWWDTSPVNGKQAPSQGTFSASPRGRMSSKFHWLSPMTTSIIRRVRAHSSRGVTSMYYFTLYLPSLYSFQSSLYFSLVNPSLLPSPVTGDNYVKLFLFKSLCGFSVLNGPRLTRLVIFSEHSSALANHLRGHSLYFLSSHKSLCFLNHEFKHYIF